MDPPPPPEQIRAQKRPLHHSPPESNRSAKRSKTNTPVSIELYSRAEQMILTNAAEILDIPIQRLLSVAAESQSASTTSENIDNSGLPFPRDSFSGSSSADSWQHVRPNEPPPPPFNLSLPEPADRAKRRLATSNDFASSSSVTAVPPNYVSPVPVSPLAQSPVDSWLESSFPADQDFGFDDGTFYQPAPPAVVVGGSRVVQGVAVNNSDFNIPTTTSAADPQHYYSSWLAFANPATQYDYGVPAPSRALPQRPPMNRNLSQHRQVMDITDSPASSSNIQPQLPQPIPTIILPQQQRLKRDHDSISEEEEISSSPDPQNNNAGGKSRKKRGPFQDPEQQRETGLTRKLKACIRCSLQRIRCLVDPKAPNGCCRTCLEVARTRLHWLPCLRYRITDAQVLDHGICPRPTWTTRWKKMEIIEIKEWASKKIKTVRITQDVAGLSYELKVRQFVPVEGDSLARKWKTKGIEQEYECTPWAMANMREAGRTLAQFVDRSLGDAVCFYVDESDRLLRNTYLMAYRYSLFAEREEERLLLRAVLRLWCASRMETRSDRICGEETLGMQPRHYEPPCANDGLILTSPVFSAQMEVVMTSLLLQPAKKEVLKRLKDLVMENQRRSWFAIYLTMFILLHSCSLLTAADNKKARKQGLEESKHRFFRLSLVEELHNGAKVLLAYFHHCNKGGHPFTMDWSSEDQMVRGELNKEQAQFMRETAEQLKAKEEIFREVRKEGKFEHDYYFISQLYDFEWKPFHTV